MRRLIVPACLLLAGVVIGAVGTARFRQPSPAARFEAPVEHDLDVTHEMSVEQAEAVRKDRFASIRTIEETLALPTDFAETEALYVIAGRADAEEVQNLIYQAARIRELEDRQAALGILFLRLAELDPRSAIAIARSPTFRAEKTYEHAVWTAWGRLDLGGALAAAKEGDSAQRELAGQALFASLRGLDDARVAEIASVLGIEPGRNVRAQQVYALYTNSPADAIRYIESLPSPADQREMFGWLAGFLARSGAPFDPALPDLISSEANRQMFRQMLDVTLASTDPEAVLRNALAANDNGPIRNQQVLRALQALANQDADKALEWAHTLQRDGDESLLVGVIGQLGQSDPERAITEARALSNPRNRDAVFTAIAAQASDPAVINRFVGMIEDSRQRRIAIVQAASILAMKSPDDAIAWASTLQASDQQVALQQIGSRLVDSDVDAAIALLGQIPNGISGTSLARQIASNLASQRSIEAAQGFIDRYKGTPEYSQLQFTVLSQLASSDPDKALRMADRIQDGRMRDSAYTSVVRQIARANPQQAISILSYIHDRSMREQAVSQIVQGMNMSDPAAAANWVVGLPSGRERDVGISALISMGQAPPDNVDSLINSMSDDSLRRQAAISHIARTAMQDPVEARRLMDRYHLTEQDRQQLERILSGSYGDVIVD